MDTLIISVIVVLVLLAIAWVGGWISDKIERLPSEKTGGIDRDQGREHRH